MPNHVQNRLKIIGSPERVAEIFSLIAGKYDDGKPMCIDFDKIIPCPQVIKDVGDSVNSLVVTAVLKKYAAPFSENPLLAGLERANRERNVLPDGELLNYEKACKAYEETGFAYWYDWSVANWGTKWNAYDQNDERNTFDTIHFCTAWSTPAPVIKRLGKIFSDVTIEVDYADEDSGCNTGKILCRDGYFFISKLDNQSKEAYEMYFDLHPDRREDYKLVGDTYEYVEEED